MLSPWPLGPFLFYHSQISTVSSLQAQQTNCMPEKNETTGKQWVSGQSGARLAVHHAPRFQTAKEV